MLTCYCKFTEKFGPSKGSYKIISFLEILTIKPELDSTIPTNLAVYLQSIVPIDLVEFIQF